MKRRRALPEWMATLRAEPEDPGGHALREAARMLLQSHAAVLIRGFPVESNQPLLALAEAIGVLPRRPPTGGDFIEDDIVYRIEARDQRLADGDGDVVVSTTGDVFPCHTDNAKEARPCDIVVLLCVRPSPPSTGETILVHVGDLTARLATIDLTALTRKRFRFGGRLESILSRDHRAIRYHRAYIRPSTGRLAGEQRSLLDRVDAVLERRDTQVRLTLRRGDCLIIDNRRLLHGRTAFPPSCRRLLKRLRLFAAN